MIDPLCQVVSTVRLTIESGFLKPRRLYDRGPPQGDHCAGTVWLRSAALRTWTDPELIVISVLASVATMVGTWVDGVR